MRAIKVLFIVLCLSTVAAYAGDLFGRVQVGANLSSISHDSLSAGEKTTSATFVSFGVGLDIPLDSKESVVLRGELWYMNKGGTFEESSSIFGVPFSVKSTERFSYLQINPLIQVKVVNSPVVGVGLFAGPGLAFLMTNHASAEFTSGGSTNSTDTTLDNSNFSSMELSVIFGAEAVIPVSSSFDIVGGLRYNLGLSNVDNPDDPPGTSEPKFTINALGVTAGVRIKL